jgi:hypothetical protein
MIQPNTESFVTRLNLQLLCVLNLIQARPGRARANRCESLSILGFGVKGETYENKSSTHLSDGTPL